jgi:hypothetical protein
VLDWVTIKRFCDLSGYSDDAVRAKLGNVWREGIVWTKAPDNRVLISLSGYDAWVEGRVSGGSVQRRSRSTSDGRGSDVVSDFASERQRRMTDSPAT